MLEIWGTVIVALASIIGIVLTQFWNFRSLKKQLILQSRGQFFYETYKDNITAFMYLCSIEAGINREKNIEKLQKLVNDRPYSFTVDFYNTFDGFVFDSKYSEKEIEKMAKKIMDYLAVLSENFYLEYLGMSEKEIDELSNIQYGFKKAKKEK